MPSNFLPTAFTATDPISANPLQVSPVSHITTRSKVTGGRRGGMGKFKPIQINFYTKKLPDLM